MQFSLFANAASRALTSITGVPSKRDTILSPSKNENVNDEDNSSPLKVFMDSNNDDDDAGLIKPFSTSCVNENSKLEQNDFTLTLTSIPQQQSATSSNNLSTLMEEF